MTRITLGLLSDTAAGMI